MLVCFKDCTVPDSNPPFCLQGVSFVVEGGAKVGLVGRTGSGKSSLFLTLYRMVEPCGGRVLIDGVDVSVLGLRHLRGMMSIIPQVSSSQKELWPTLMVWIWNGLIGMPLLSYVIIC